MELNSKPSRGSVSNLSYAPDLDHEQSLRDLFKMLARRRWLIALTVILFTGLATAAVMLMTPKYTATVELVFQSKPLGFINVEAALTGEPQDDAALESDVAVLQSRDIATAVVDSLRLVDDPEFNENLPPYWPAERVRRWLADQAQYVSQATGVPVYDWFFAKDEMFTPEQAREIERQQVVDNFIEQLKAVRVPTSRVANVSFTSEDPVKASTIANAVADTYMTYKLEKKFDANRRASTWLADRVQTLRQQVQASERAVEEYRSKFGLLQGGQNVSLIVEQVSQLSAQLTEARIARNESQSRLAQVQRLQASGGDLTTLEEVLQSPLIQRLREQEADVARRIADLSSEYGPRHPRIVNLEAERKQHQEQISTEVRKIIAGILNTAEVARRREENLSSELQELQRRLAQANAADVGLRNLQRDADANRALLEQLMTSFSQARAQEDPESQQSDAAIISRAPIPTEPSAPKKLLFIALAFAFSGVLGVLVAVVIEQLDAGYRSSEQIERHFGISVLSHVPELTGSAGKRPSDYVLKHPNSRFGEALRALHIGLKLQANEPSWRSVMFTSAQPEEGKSTISLSLARLQARVGRRVVFIDTDYRATSIAKRIGLKERPGLLDYLGGSTPLSEVVQKDAVSGCDVIPAGTFLSNGSELLGSPRMKELIASLSQSYDLVVVDAPPILPLSDTRVLASVADRTVLVVRWASTQKRVLRFAINEMEKSGVHIDGIVLSMVDFKRQLQYTYGDAGQYHARTDKYYVKTRA